MSLRYKKFANHLDVKNSRQKKRKQPGGNGSSEIRIHSSERNPNLQKVLITVSLPRPCWIMKYELFVAWPWQNYSLLQGENWKVIDGHYTLVLKLLSVYADSCYCFIFFFYFSRVKREYLNNFIHLTFKPLRYWTELEDAEYNAFFPPSPQAFLLGDKALTQLPAGSCL